MKKLKHKKIICFLLVVCGISFLSYNIFSPKQRTKRLANNYLKKLKNNQVVDSSIKDSTQLSYMKVHDYKLIRTVSMGKHHQAHYNVYVEDKEHHKGTIPIIISVEEEGTLKYNLLGAYQPGLEEHLNKDFGEDDD